MLLFYSHCVIIEAKEVHSVNRLAELREKRGWKAKEAAAALHLAYTTYLSYENETRQMYSELLLRLADFYEVSVDYLLGRSNGIVYLRTKLDEKFDSLDERGKKTVSALLDVEAEQIEKPIIDYGTIRKYLSRPAAGFGGLVEGEDYEDIPRTAETPREADFALVVSGDSMEPYIHDGETIYVTQKAALDKMDVGVFFVDGATYVKQYAPSYDGSVYLLSANPDRESANVFVSAESNRSLQCFGKVILPKKLPAPVYR